MTPYEQWQLEKYGNYIPEVDADEYADESPVLAKPTIDTNEDDEQI